MPIYEFHCDDCRRDSEILVRSSNWKGTRCPHCGSTHLDKKLSVFASSVGDGGEPPASACRMDGGGGCGCRCGGRSPHRH